VVTAGGVTSALDLGLHLVEKFWGSEVRKRIATQMEYGPAFHTSRRPGGCFG